MRSVKTTSAATSRPVAPRHRFGAHLSTAGGLHNAVRLALRLRCETVQVFVKNQRQWNAPPLADDDVRQWLALRHTPGFGPPVAHAAYLINLGSPDAELYKRSQAALTDELQRCQALDIPYLVVHPGSAKGSTTTKSLARVARALNQIFSRNPALTTMPLLETTAGQGDALGRTFEELGAIIEQLKEPERVGVCIDTCHVFAAGYDIRRRSGYTQMIEAARNSVGLERIRCWHLNDSHGPCGSHLDRHEHIGRGRLGSTGLRQVLADPQFLDVPMIIETPKGTNGIGRDWDRVNLQRLRTIDAIAARERRVRAPTPRERKRVQ